MSAISATPLTVRAVVAAAAGMSGDRHPALYSILETYSEETDFHLGVQLSVDYHQLRQARGDVDGLIEHLSAEMDRPGSDFDERRTISFAGLVVLDEPQAVLKSKRGRNKVRLQTYRSEGVSSVFGALLVKKWDMLKSKLGSDFVGAVLSGDHSAWEDIARFAGPYPEVRNDFFEWCTIEENIGLPALRNLAEYWPRSRVLLMHVLRILRRKGSYNHQTLPITIAAAEILRDQFSTPEYVAELSTLFEKTPEVHTGIALAILDPAAQGLHQRRIPTLEIGVDRGAWLAAAQIASRLDPPNVFVSIVHAMAERVTLPGRPSQAQVTDVLVERVIRDVPSRTCLRASLEEEVSPDAFVVSAGILARAGYFDAGLFEKCASRLASERARKGIPISVFDIGQNAMRPYAHVLMEFFQLGGSS